VSEAVDRLLAKLAMVRVPAHVRRASHGELVNVDAYTYRRKYEGGIGPGIMIGPVTVEDVHRMEKQEAKAALRRKIVDYKTDRPLTGGEDIEDVIPGTEMNDYMDLPFLDELHERMGVDPSEPDVSTEDYMAARNRLFSEENTTDEMVPFEGLRVTQRMVNRDKARALIGLEFDPPPYVVRYSNHHYVINGHHRVVAEAMAGKEGTRARVLDLTTEYTPIYQSAVDRLGVKLSVVVVPPHIRMVDGKVVRVEGYTYDREGASERMYSPRLPSSVPSERRQRAALIEERVTQAKADGKETRTAHATKIGTDKFGEDVYQWTAERSLVHDEILEHFWNKEFADASSEGKAVISGGIAGAGKSTVLKGHADIERERYGTVNPDDIKEYMAERGLVPEVEGLSPMEASALVHEESSYLAKRLANRAYVDRKNLIWDITMGSRDTVEQRIETMREFGYEEIHGVFVDIPVETSVIRAADRWWEGVMAFRSGESSIGGRYVSPSMIRRAQPKGMTTTQNRQVFEELRARFDSWEMWNTDGPPPPRRVATSEGRT
jgi:hypothetical protein